MVFLVEFIAVLLGMAVYGTLGFGLAFVVIPLVAAVQPAALPPLIWFLGVPFAVLMVAREHTAVDVRSFAAVTAGKVLGTPLGALLLVDLPRDLLRPLLASLLIAAAGLVAAGRGKAVGAVSGPGNAVARVLAGFASGVMGTAAALGGPPLALSLRDHEPASFRATLAMCFVVGDAMSLLALSVAGQVHWWQVRLAVELVPAMLLGFALSRYTIRRVNAGLLRLAVLAFACASATLVLVGSLRGWV